MPTGSKNSSKNPQPGSTTIELSFGLEDYLCRGLTLDQIKLQAAESAADSGETPPTEEEYAAALALCVDRWKADANTDDPIKAWHVRIRKYLIQKSVNLNDFKTAGTIVKDLANLQGLYGKTKPIPERDQEPVAPSPQRNQILDRIRLRAVK